MKHFLKYFVDLTLLLGLVAVAVTGLLLGFVIPLGRVPYPGKYFLGLHRHLWADIHLSLALFFLLLILLHLGLNWNWLVLSTRQYFLPGKILSTRLSQGVVGSIGLAPGDFSDLLAGGK